MASEQNMAMVLQALKNAGLSDNQARILGAEIGRENSFQDKYLWGYHKDPKNGKTNIGIISWQGTRAKGVERALENAGLIQNGKIVKGQESLDIMAKYLVNEIRTDPTYKATKKQFLDNPNVDYNTGAKVLGRDYIKWRYDDADYSSGHKNRDMYYAKLGGVAPQEGYTASSQAVQPPFKAQPPFMAQLREDPQLPQVDLFGGADNNILGLNFDLFTALQGMSGGQQPTHPLLPAPFM